MKKVIILIILVLFIFNGCNTGANKKNIEKPDISVSNAPGYTSSPSGTEKPDITVNTELPDNFTRVDLLSFSYIAGSTLKYSKRSDWQNYIKEKFDTDIIVNYIATTPQILLNRKRIITDILYLNKARGLPALYTADVLKYGTDAFAYNLSPYYEKYGWYDYIENDYIEALTVNGGIYAVPAANPKYIIPRFYNSKFLNELNFDVPTDTAEFYEYLRAAKLSVEDENFYPMYILFIASTKSTADIFRAFDVYVNSSWNTTITFNPNTGTFEDGAFSDNIEIALNYIRQLQDEKLLKIYGTSQYGADDSGMPTNRFDDNLLKVTKEFATEYNYVFNVKTNGFGSYTKVELPYEYKKGYYLSNINSKNVCEVRSDLAFYIFSKDIVNIHGVIDKFNEVFTDGSYFADLRYGMENTDYTVIDGYPVMNLPDYSALLDLKLIKPANDQNSSYESDSTQVISNMSSERMYEENVFNSIRAYIDLMKYQINFDRDVDLLFHSRVIPFDAIEEYKKEFIKSGKFAAIQELNEKMGTIPVYDYGN